MELNPSPTPCLALVAPGVPAAADAALLVRQALTQRGELPWPAAEIEVYPGGSESLILAHPAAREQIYISAGAVQFLAAYFDIEEA